MSPCSQAFSHRKSKTRGYLSFHRKSRFVRKAPFYILSVGSMLLLLFSVVWEQSDKESDKSRMTCTSSTSTFFQGRGCVRARLTRF